MGSRAVNLDKHILALLAAKGDVVSGRAAASWALFAYEKSNELKLLDSGAGGPDELAKRFQSGSVMYGLCRLPDAATGQQQVVLISWVGEKVSEQLQEECASHLPAIRAFFKEAALVVKACRAEEVTQDGLRRTVALLAPLGGTSTKKALPGDPQELVGTSYKKTNAALELLQTKRGSFWAQAEREEEERREAERRQAQEERRRWEHQRMEAERREAAERERRIQEKEQQIQEWRKQQAEMEAEERRREAARRQEAAELVATHSRDPRDFFQQRERLGSAGGASEPPSSAGGWPGTPRRPFLRYQRSLTESAYIFRRQDPAPGPPSGAFLPSASPCSLSAAPLLSPRQLTPPPIIDPKPGAPPLSPTPVPARRPPSLAPPPRTRAPPRAGDRPTGSLPGAVGVQVQPLLSTPGVTCLPELQPPQPPTGAPSCELPPSSDSFPGPSEASATTPPPQPTTEPSQPGASPIPSPSSPLAAPRAETWPPTGSTGLSSWSLDHLGEPPQGSPLPSAPPAEEGPARGDEAAALQAEPAPPSGHNGMAAADEGRAPGGQGPGTYQGDPAADAELPGAALCHPGAGDRAHRGHQDGVLECGGGAGDHAPCPAETTVA